jgi:hypothetical protein
VATNPYLSDQANAITNQVTGNLQNRVLPNLNMGSAATGNFGSNRHMIAQGQAIGDTNQGLSNSLANLYGNAYAQDQQLAAQQSMHSAGLQNQYQIAQMNDATQRQGLQNQYNLGMGNLGLGYGNLGLGYTQAGNQFALGQGNLALGNRQADQSYNLGLGGLANQWQANQNNYNLGMGNQNLGYYNADQGFYNANRGMDLQQMGLAANLFNQGNQGLAGAGQGMQNIGQQQMLNSWYPFQQYGGQLGQFGGFNQSTSQTQPGPSSFQTGLGGALTAAQLWQLLNSGGGGGPTVRPSNNGAVPPVA